MKFSYKCPKCKHEFEVHSFTLAHSPLCPKCNEIAARVFKPVSVGTVVDDNLIVAADTILHGQLPSGNSKVVF